MFFLKPPELKYKGFPHGCHNPDPNAPRFKVASDWVESHGFQPFNLQRDWWLNKNDNVDSYAQRAKNGLSNTGMNGQRIV